MSDPSTRDPWVIAGMAVLVTVTIGAGAVYTSQPGSVEEARVRAWSLARPSSSAAQLARARETLGRAEGMLAAADAVRADTLFAEAAHDAARAATLGGGAPDPAAREVWGRALLGRARAGQALGVGRGMRRDDTERLGAALAMAEQVAAARVTRALTAEAAALAAELRRQLRVGPLEWLPLPP